MQPSPQEAAQELLRRRRARSNLLDFITFTEPSYVVCKFHATLCAYLDRIISGEIKRLMVFAPPQHGKSQIVSRHFPAYAMGRNPDLRVIGASYSADLAGRMNRDIQRIIDDDGYRRVFSGVRLADENNRTIAGGPLRNSDIFEIVGRRGSYRAAGLGQGITGMPCDLAIVDDPVKDDKEAFSPVERKACLEWYTGSLYTRLSQDASVLLTMTRWHRQDLAGALLNAEDHDWTVISFPAIAPDTPADYDHREPGEPLCPPQPGGPKTKWKGFDLKALEDRRQTLGPTKWSAMYEQNPRPEGSAEFPQEWFQSTPEREPWFDHWPDGWFCKVLALDPSKGKKETKDGDYSAFIKLMIDPNGIGWCEAILEKIHLTEIAERAIEICREWQPDAFAVEAEQFQELLASQISDLSLKYSVGVPATPVFDRSPKKVRIRRLTPFLSRNHIRFKTHSPGTRLLVEQLTDFPNGDHDDGPDALEMAVRKACELVRGNTQSVPEEFV